MVPDRRIIGQKRQEPPMGMVGSLVKSWLEPRPAQNTYRRRYEGRRVCDERKVKLKIRFRNCRKQLLVGGKQEM
jgi:hypothetical protein